MNITKFIKNHEELNELPFLIVFRTMQILDEMGMLNHSKGDGNVETVQS